MKIECDVIKDLLPLYIEQLTSEKSGQVIREHMEECGECRRLYEELNAPVPRVQYDREPAESLYRYIKKKKRSSELKGVAIVMGVVLLIIAIRLVLTGAAVGFLAFDSMNAEIYEDTDASHYPSYMGENARKEYAHKWGMDESIFPKEISGGMNVTDYKMVYYDPWDAQYLSYLVVEYGEAYYEAEAQRLREYDSTEYLGCFGAEGFREEYTLLAMEADPYFGLVYALAGENNQIVYVELIFCNYFYDIDYKNMIREDYLPVGFDATRDNAYRQQMLPK